MASDDGTRYVWKPRRVDFFFVTPPNDANRV